MRIETYAYKDRTRAFVGHNISVPGYIHRFVQWYLAWSFNGCDGCAHFVYEDEQSHKLHWQRVARKECHCNTEKTMRANNRKLVIKLKMTGPKQNAIPTASFDRGQAIHLYFHGHTFLQPQKFPWSVAATKVDLPSITINIGGSLRFLLEVKSRFHLARNQYCLIQTKRLILGMYFEVNALKNKLQENVWRGRRKGSLANIFRVSARGERTPYRRLTSQSNFYSTIRRTVLAQLTLSFVC